MIAIDTNLLVYAHRSDMPEHRRTQQALQQAASDTSGWGVSLPVLAEFWSVVTSPRAFSKPSTAAQAASFIRTLVREGEMRVWSPGDGFSARLLEKAVQLSITRARIFDLQIALIAADCGARELWTHDLNFVRFPGIKIRDPL